MASNSSINEGHSVPSSSFDGFERQLPDNCVEYLLFVIDDRSDGRKQLSQIESVRQSAVQLANAISKDYIWQKDEFNLELKNEQGLVYLHGLTDYSDAVEDEWLIVYTLRELTRVHADLWVRVFDTDGEFLLVEAANVLPKWLNPEIDHNRVWLHDGKLRIIPLKEEIGLSSRNLSLPDAIEIVKAKPDALVHSTFVEAEAFYRLEKYPGQIANSIHYSKVTVPRRVAYLLHSLPKSIAPAVEAFYLRDPIVLKRVISPTEPLRFPVEDLVTISVRFSKVLFAQLRSQHFEAPPRWQTVIQKAQKATASSSSDKEKNATRLETGMKLTCGFEMLAQNAEKSKSRVVRELALMLEDLDEDGDDALPSDEDIRSWKDVDRDDSEAWLDINYDDFERELDGKRGAVPKDAANSGFGDAKTQSDLRKIVSRFEAFLNDEDAGVEGVELDDMDMDDDDDDDEVDSDLDSEAEDKEVSFDEDEFARMMREMMGLPSTDTEPKTTAQPKAVAKPDDVSEDEEVSEIRNLTSQLEAELNEHGALALDPATEKQAQIKGKGKAMTTKGIPKADDEEEDSEEEVDIDYNLAKNLLESFKSQAGMAGPAGNLLGMMGFQLPRDEDDGNEDEEDGGSSSQQAKKR